MAKGYKNGQSLHFLIEHAPLEILADFFDEIEDGLASSLSAALRISENKPQSDECDLRARLLDLSSTLSTDDAARLDGHAQRIAPLAENRGPEILKLIRRRIFDARLLAEFDAQLDDLGRCIWLYLRDRDRFEDADALYHADHVRGAGRLYDAYEIVDDAGTFDWTPELKLALETRISEKLDLTGPCVITYLSTGQRDSGDEVHYLIARHGGPLSSVSEFRDDGRQGRHYYRPPNEATLVYAPTDNTIEVYAATNGVRQALARSFVEAGLGHDLSNRPLTQKNYDLSRFLTSFQLPVVEVDDFDIIENKVVGAAVWPDGSRRRAALDVDIKDDIERATDELFGARNVFRRAAAISKIAIAVRYRIPAEPRERTLNIALGQANKCNLSSKRSPTERKLGFALLEKWRILHSVEPLSDHDERAVLPALVVLFDQDEKHESGQFFVERGLDVDELLRTGFIVRKGRYTKHWIHDDDASYEAEISASKKPGFVCYECPVSGQHVDLRRENFDKYEINSNWLEEVLLKGLLASLSKKAIERLDRRLIFLGTIDLDANSIPCYLARGLDKPKNLKRVDGLLRARSDQGVGLVLSTGVEDQPSCIGANIVLSIADYLLDGDEPGLLSIERLTDAYLRGRQMARGGTAVDLVKNGPHSAALHIPGKPPCCLIGGNKITIVERLVLAHRRGSPAVTSAELLTGMSVRSPSQAFGSSDWAQIYNVYIGHASVRRVAATILRNVERDICDGLRRERERSRRQVEIPVDELIDHHASSVRGSHFGLPPGVEPDAAISLLRKRLVTTIGEDADLVVLISILGERQRDAAARVALAPEAARKRYQRACARLRSHLKPGPAAMDWRSSAAKCGWPMDKDENAINLCARLKDPCHRRD